MSGGRQPASGVPTVLLTVVAPAVGSASWRTVRADAVRDLLTGHRNGATEITGALSTHPRPPGATDSGHRPGRL